VLLYHLAFLFGIYWSEGGVNQLRRDNVRFHALKQFVLPRLPYREPKTWDVGPYYHRLAFLFSIASGQWAGAVVNANLRVRNAIQRWESAVKGSRLPYNGPLEHYKRLAYVNDALEKYKRLVYVPELRHFVEICPNEPLARFLRVGPRP